MSLSDGRVGSSLVLVLKSPTVKSAPAEMEKTVYLTAQLLL
jgi:hypothetical protein